METRESGALEQNRVTKDERKERTVEPYMQLVSVVSRIYGIALVNLYKIIDKVYQVELYQLKKLNSFQVSNVS